MPAFPNRYRPREVDITPWQCRAVYIHNRPGSCKAVRHKPPEPNTLWLGLMDLLLLVCMISILVHIKGAHKTQSANACSVTSPEPPEVPHIRQVIKTQSAITCWVTSPQPPRKPVLEDLKLHKVIGKGGWGYVRRATHNRSGKTYALKVMLKEGIRSENMVERVRGERITMGMCHHPMIVELVAAYQDKHALHLLQEWIPGGTLQDVLRSQGALQEHVAKFYAANLVLVLEYLHGKGIVHRDLKPDNILLDGKGFIKLTDFGFGAVVGEGRDMVPWGTPLFMAPEILRKEGAGTCSDIWSMGVILFQMLTGYIPFTTTTSDINRVYQKVLRGKYVLPSTVSVRAQDLLYRLLKVHPNNRLGAGPEGPKKIREHAFFEGTDWDGLLAGTAVAPYTPDAMTQSIMGMQTPNEMKPGVCPTGPKHMDWDEALWAPSY